MKRFSSIFVAVLFVMSFMIVALPGTADAFFYKTVKFKLTSSSKVSWVKLYVDGAYKGIVRKSSYKLLKLRAAKSYRIVAKKTMGRRYFERKKTLRVTSSRSSNQTCFLHVTRKSRSAVVDEPVVSSRYKNIKFKLTSSSKVSWAKLYVNGAYKGHVRKSSYTTVRLRSGKSYRIVAKKTMGYRYFERKKTLRVTSSSSSSQTCFLHVSQKSGSTDGDAEPVVSSRYKTVKFKLTSSSKVSWAELYVNDAYKGHVRKSSYTTVRLLTGRLHRIVVKRAKGGRSYEIKKTLNVTSDGSLSQTCLLHIAQNSKYKLVKFKLTRSSKVSLAKIYVNGAYKGDVRKSRYKYLKLQIGKSYRIVAKKTIGSRYFERKKTLYVTSKSTSEQSCFLHVSRKSGSSYSDDEPVVSSRYKTVKFKLTSTSKVSWANLYVNGVNKGRVRKSSYTRVRLKSGESYRIDAKKTMGSRSFERTKTLNVTSGSSSSQTCFLHVSQKSGSADKIVKFKLTRTTKPAWAKLYVNGHYKGHVRKSSYTSLRLGGPKVYRIEAIGTYRGESYVRSKTLYVKIGSESQTCFLHMKVRHKIKGR